MAYNERKMLEDVNGDLIPQYYDPVDDAFKPLLDERAELQEIKQTQAQILDRLNEPIDTQVTGSIVGEVVFESVEVASGSSIQTPVRRIDSPYYTSYIRGVTEPHEYTVRNAFQAVDVYSGGSTMFETENYPNIVSNRNHTTGEKRWEILTTGIVWIIENDSEETQEYLIGIWRFNI